MSILDKMCNPKQNVTMSQKWINKITDDSNVRSIFNETNSVNRTYIDVLTRRCDIIEYSDHSFLLIYWDTKVTKKIVVSSDNVLNMYEFMNELNTSKNISRMNKLLSETEQYKSLFDDLKQRKESMN